MVPRDGALGFGWCGRLGDFGPVDQGLCCLFCILLHCLLFVLKLEYFDLRKYIICTIIYDALIDTAPKSLLIIWISLNSHNLE